MKNCIFKICKIKSVKELPHPSKIKKGGEDAQSTLKDLITVADGVGGWI